MPRVGEPCTFQSRIAKLVIQAFEIGWASAVERFGASHIKNHGVQFESFRELADQLVRECLAFVDQ